MAQMTYMIQPDPFLGQSSFVASYIPSASDTNDVASDKESASRAATVGMKEVGRPTHGIRVKPNTAAFAQVIAKNGVPRALLNQLGQTITEGGVRKPRPEGDPAGKVWTDWFLQTVREERTEKTQLLETFGDTYLFAFGQKPRTLVFQGTLMNTQDFNWRATFWENWDAEFRATQLIKNEARMYISWDDVLVEGYPINAVTHQVADSQNAMVFSFTFFVTNYVSLAKRNNWDNEKRQTIPLASFRSRVPPVKENELVGITQGQRIVQLTGLRGVRVLSDIARQKVGTALTGNSRAALLADLAGIATTAAGNLAYGTLARANSAAEVQNLLAYETARFTREAFATTLYSEARKKGLSVGDVNMWFGYASVIARQLARGLPAAAEALSKMPTTVDGLLQEMGFAVQEGIRAKPAAIKTAAADAPAGPTSAT